MLNYSIINNIGTYLVRVDNLNYNNITYLHLYKI